MIEVEGDEVVEWKEAPSPETILWLVDISEP